MITHKLQPLKYIHRSVVIIFFLLCCSFLMAFPPSGKNKAFAIAIEALDTSNDPCSIAKELAQKHEKQAVEPLIKLIKRHEDKQVQKCAAEALATIDIDKSVNNLIESLKDSDLLAASRSAFALGVIKDKRAIAPLLTALFESKIPCPAAVALGMIRDSSALAPLIKALQHEDSSIRGCAIQALALYDDPRLCGTLTDVFMTDNDQIVQFMARSAKEALKCPSADKQHTKYAIADKYCILGQRLIDVATPLLENTQGLKDWQTNKWQKSPAWEKITAENFPQPTQAMLQSPEGQKDFEMKLTIYSLVTEWGGNVVHYRLIPKDKTTPEPEEVMRSGRLSAVKEKMERLLQLCPNLKIPDYKR